MSRPLKNNIEYFSHDSDMRNDPKIKAVRAKFGLEGYAIYNLILEFLSDSECLQIELSDLNYELMAGDFDIQSEKLREILKYFITLDLFQIENNYLLCRSLDNRSKPVFDKRKQELPSLRSGNRVNSPETGISGAETIQSKVKESKEKKINTIVEFPTEIDDLYNFFISTIPERFIPKTDTLKNSWKDALYKCHRIDKYEYWQIKDIIDIFREDEFWTNNFFSPLKLRALNKDGIKYIDYFYEKIKDEIEAPK